MAEKMLCPKLITFTIISKLIIYIRKHVSLAKRSAILPTETESQDKKYLARVLSKRYFDFCMLKTSIELLCHSNERENYFIFHICTVTDTDTL